MAAHILGVSLSFNLSSTIAFALSFFPACFKHSTTCDERSELQ